MANLEDFVELATAGFDAVADQRNLDYAELKPLATNADLKAEGALAGLASLEAGLGTAASKNVGQAAGDVAAGDDSRIVGALQSGANLADLPDPEAGLYTLGGAKRNLTDATYKTPGRSSAEARPALDRLVETRYLSDFVDPAQWAACRAGTPTQVATNSQGVDAFSAAMEDIVGNVRGRIIIPEGTWRLPQIVLNKGVEIVGMGEGSVIQTTSATEDQIVVNAGRVVIRDVAFASTVTRTAGSCVVSNNSGYFEMSGITAFYPYTTFHLKGHPTDPALDKPEFSIKRVRAYNTEPNAYAFIVGGGYFVHFTDVIAQGDATVSAQTQAAAGLLVTRVADFCVDGNSQFLNCVRPMIVSPETGDTVASMRVVGGFLGTSYAGSLVTCAGGGSVVSFAMSGVWAGENLYSGGGVTGSGNGLTLIGGAAGRFQGAVLSGCEFPLAQFNGLDADAHVEGLQVIGGWADGCGGAGYSFNGTKGFSLIGVKSGSVRFTVPHGAGAYLDSTCDNFRVALNDFKGATTALTNSAGTGPTKLVELNIT